MDMATRGMGAVGRWVHGHVRLTAAGVASVAAGAVAVAVQRRRGRRQLDLPEPGALAAEAAVSVHNAAKGSVLRAVHVTGSSDPQVVCDAVRDAVQDGAEAGVDVGAAVIGAVEGAEAVASELGVDHARLVAAAATVALDAARRQGQVAGDRAHDLLAPLLS